MALRFLTAGESHGPGLSVILDGIPSGLHLDPQQVDAQLRRRQGGYGRGGRMKIEQDRAEFTSGVRFGTTLGTPIAMQIPNRDHRNWTDIMSPFGPEPDPVKRSVSAPRPGHADLAGGAKHRFEDLRNVLERASARETAARVAAGSIARQFLEACGLRICGHTRRIGALHCSLSIPEDVPYDEIEERAARNDLAVLDADLYAAMIEEITAARSAGDTLGGIVEALVLGAPPGLGSHVQWDRKLDARVAQAIMSIPAVKGVEIGDAFENAGLRGSAVHDPVERGPEGHLQRPRNRAGGLEGGITNGEPLVVRAAMKPLSTLMKPLATIDLKTGQPAQAAVERSDVCAVPACGVVVEAMLALALADAWLEKFAGDTMEDVLSGYRRYQQEVARWTRSS